jgi:tetratricopeptide (TPR) repeat protein
LQLHLKKFYALKNDRGHKLYEWAREFSFAGINKPEQNFKHTPEACQALERKLALSLLDQPIEMAFRLLKWELESLGSVLVLQRKFNENNELSLICNKFLDSVRVSNIVRDDETPIEKAWRLCNEKKYEEAYSAYEEALAICRETQGEDHLDVVSILDAMGNVLRFQSKYDEALPLYEQALTIKRNALGDDHPDLVGIVNTIISMLYTKDKDVEQLPFRRLLLTIKRKELGDNHPDVGEIL